MFKNLLGQVFGRLTVIEFAGHNNNGKVCWKCVCSCPERNVIVVPACRLKNGETRSCGCLRKELSSKSHFVDLTGRVFGRLTVVRRVDNGHSLETRFECECSCDNHTRIIVSARSLVSGKTKSCGCFRKERISELKTKWATQDEIVLASRLSDMKKRCYNPNSQAYADYGGRGIYVCDEWLRDSKAFVNWALSNGFRRDLTIDRINNDGPYAPWNCRWVSMESQCNNRRSNISVEINGINHTLTEWSKMCGISTWVLSDRLNKGYETFRTLVLSNLK